MVKDATLIESRSGKWCMLDEDIVTNFAELKLSITIEQHNLTDKIGLWKRFLQS